MTNTRDQRGSITLTMAISVALTVGAFMATIMTLTSSEIWKARAEGDRIRAEVLADDGIEAGLIWVRQARDHATADEPFELFDALDPSQWTQIATDEPVVEGGEIVGSYSVWVRPAPTPWSDPRTRTVQLRAEGSFRRGRGNEVTKVTKRRIAQVERARSEVFEYAYFLDNWGWLYSSAMTVRGNVRANGPFGFGGHAPTIEAQPRPHRVDVLPTGGYDLDGLRDGGGVYAGWAITGQSALQGSAANAVNQHGFQDPVAMPELQSRTPYEALALQLGSSVTVSAGLLEPLTLGPVVGDGAGEAQHLYLFGTASQPIHIDGPIVVRGNVYLAGVVTGRGAIHAGGNVYVGDDLVYLNPPVPLRPATLTETDVETWLAQNAARDALGLYAREHIVIGDASTSEFQNAVSPWLTDTRNQSAEVAVGVDGIHNTLTGRDGVLGTDDDDVLEDTAWNVSYYTTQHLAQGLVPRTRLVGDVIPGSVEDKDGDGQVDATIVLADLIPTSTVWAETWAGNRLGGLSYADVATNDIDRIDAALCSAHAIAGRLNSTATIRFYGCLASRNEALVFAATAVEMLHDVRLLLDVSSPFFPPNAWRHVRSWPVSDFDMSAAGSGINVGS